MGFADTLPLVHGLGWLTALMFAAVWPSLPDAVGRRHVAWLIGFCVVRLLVAAQALISNVGADVRQLAAVVSGALLWEFARRVWNDRRGPRLSAATHLVVVEILALVFAASSADGARPEWFLPVDVLYSVLPGLLGAAAAWLLWRCFADEQDSLRRAAFRLAALGFAFFALPENVAPSWTSVPPWLATVGLGFACLSLPLLRTRTVLACAVGVALVALIGPPAVSAQQRHLTQVMAANLKTRGERAAAPLQGRFAARLGAKPRPTDLGDGLGQYFEQLRITDPIVHAATLHRFENGKLQAIGVGRSGGVETRPVSAEERAGFATGQRFFIPASIGDRRPFATVWTPLVPDTFESPTAWLAVEFPGVFWDLELQQTRRLGIVLVGVLATFCAMGFVLVVRQRLEAAQQLDLERSRAADRAKTEFLAFLGHELRTPLQTILGRAELLREHPAAARHAAAIEAQGALLLRLVTDLLDLGTIEAGHFRLQPQPFALRQALAAVEDTARGPAATKNLRLVVKIAPAVPDLLVGDETRLRQILGNLLGNAVKYTARGEVTLHVSLDSVRPPPSAVCPLVFTVRDTGPGLPVEKIPQLFTLFSRLDAGDTFTREGTGVGLALVRRLCALMDGEVSAGNRPEGGAEFTVRLSLPLAQSTVSAASAEPATVVGDGLGVLVAEDNTAARELLAEALRGLGHRVEAVSDGPSALEAATTQYFDAVLLDINLPGLDGVAIARQLRARQTTARIIACSAEALPAVREAALAAGCDEFLVKPVTLAALGQAIAPTAAAAPANLFDRLTSPAAISQTRALLCREWPRLRTETEAAVAAGDSAAPRRLAHYLQSSALLLADETLLGLCRRLSTFSAAAANDNPRAPLDEIEHHFAAWPVRTASPSSATTPPR